MVNLFSPITIENIRIKNRIVLPPIHTELSTEKGKPTTELYNHFDNFSSNIGLIIVGHSYISQKGKLSRNQLGIHEDWLIPHLRKISKTIHRNETKVAIQINHAGGRTKKELIGRIPIAPSINYFKPKIVSRLNLDEIKEIKSEFVDAAIRAEKSAFDALEIHGAHGYLLNQFTSPLSNNRKDEFGGTFENRIRFPLEVVQEVNKNVNLPILYRLGADDRKNNGFTIEEAKKYSKKLEKVGVDILDISGGFCGSVPEDLEEKQGFFVPLAEEIKKTVDIPVIGVGGIKDPKFANEIIKNDKADFVAVGREQIDNPYWADKAKEILDK